MPDETSPTALATALAHLPDETLVPVGYVKSLIGENGRPRELHDDDDLLDVPAIAALLHRSRSTARLLCAKGLIPNAFLFRNREWRARRSDVDAFLDNERERHRAAQQAADEAPPSARTARRARKL